MTKNGGSSKGGTIAALTLACCAAVAAPCFAVPPLVSGDVPTAEKGLGEVYLGFQKEETGGREYEAPANEVVLGISSWQEVTFELPYLIQRPQGTASQSGFGDAVLGTKMVFLHETTEGPGAAVSFETKLTNADAGKGLGSGAVDYDIRLRAQKTFGWFTAIGNAGYTFVGEPVISGLRRSRRNVLFLSFAQEYQIAPKTMLLSEFYSENSDTPGEPARFAGNIGFSHELRSWLQVHAAAGKSLRAGGTGGPELRLYAGFMLEFPVFVRRRII